MCSNELQVKPQTVMATNGQVDLPLLPGLARSVEPSVVRTPPLLDRDYPAPVPGFISVGAPEQCHRVAGLCIGDNSKRCFSSLLIYTP